MALHISTGPHLRAKADTQRLMLDVLIALCPATAASIYFYGIKAVLIILVSVAAAVLSEFVWQKLAHKPIRISDLSAAVTGLLLALNPSSKAVSWRSELLKGRHTAYSIHEARVAGDGLTMGPQSFAVLEAGGAVSR